MKKPSAQKCSEAAFHVDHNKTHDRWDVIDAEGRVLGFCHEQGAAVGLAIREAQHFHGQGDEVVVCVEQPDGHYTMAWSSQH